MRWASAVDTDNSLRAAVEHAAETVFLGLGRQEPDLAIVFTGFVTPLYTATSSVLIYPRRAMAGSRIFTES